MIKSLLAAFAILAAAGILFANLLYIHTALAIAASSIGIVASVTTLRYMSVKQHHNSQARRLPARQ